MEKKNCNIIRDMLPLYIDDVVCSDTREWVEEHLTQCSECALLADKLRQKPELPANPNLHQENVKRLSRFKKRVMGRKLGIILCSALAALIVSVTAMYWLLSTVEVVEYDGSNIAIEEDIATNQLYLCFYDQGDILWSAGTDRQTGETNLQITQRMWDKYIDPLYDKTPPRYYFSTPENMILIRLLDTGEILWEANDQQKALYFESHPVESDATLSGESE